MIAVTAPIPIGRDAAREAAQHELSKHIYHRYDDSWPIALLKWLEHELAKLFDTAGRHAPGGGAGALAFVALLVAVVLIARWRIGPLGRRAKAPPAVLGDVRRTAAEHRSAAEAAAARSDWDAAVIEGMRAVARQLEESGVLDPKPGRTADELAQDAGRRSAGVAGPVAAAAVAFDAVAYGKRPANADGYAVVRRADDAVRGRRHATATA